MAFQEQQQQPPPGFVYPNSGSSLSNNPAPSSHSSGSFGAVFIVLAVIVVVSALACFLSRLCSRKHHQKSPKQPKQSKQSHHHGPPMPRPEMREPKQGHHGSFNDRGMEDIEFGFGKGFPSGKHGEMAKGAKAKPNVRFEFRSGDPRVAAEREQRGGEFGAI